jgi:hypothetical protein
MEIKGDVLVVSSGKIDTVTGDVVEPEQQVARRIITTDAEVAYASGEEIPSTGIATQIVFDSSVLEVATAAKGKCHNCKWFDTRTWHKTLAKADAPDAPLAVRQDVNTLRAQLLELQYYDAENRDEHDDLDVEMAMKSMGFCSALESVTKEATLVHPMAHCPDAVKSIDRPLGLYEPADAEAEARGAAVYDSLLRQAQGKTP